MLTRRSILAAAALAAVAPLPQREQHLTALDGRAAAAAHELGTPLATITVVDVYAVASRVRQETYITYEPLLLLAAVYLAITGVIVWAFGRLERRVPARLG